MDGNPKKVLAKPIGQYETMREALAGLADKTKKKYLQVMPQFCEFVGKDPDTIIRERRGHERSTDERTKRTYERALVEFYNHLKKSVRESSAFVNVAVVRGFFSRNYCKTIFKRGDLRAPKTEALDITPTLGEIKEICDAADIRDKAIIILALQTGIAPVDLVGLQRADFERAIKSNEFPQSLGWLQRNKSREEFHPFLFHDSATALKRYLRNRKDNSPYLFVDRSGRPLQERNVNEIFTKAAKRAGIVVPPGKRLRVYCLRSVFETQMGNGGMPQTWIDMMMGHMVQGSRGKYAKPSEADWLEKARKGEPFISISRVRNMDILTDRINAARQGDMLEILRLLEREMGKEKLKRLARGYLALEVDTQYTKDDLASSRYVLTGAFNEYLAPHKHKRKEPRKHRRGT